MEQRIEISDLPALAAELIDEAEAGGGPFLIVRNQEVVAILRSKTTENEEE